jgi:hypothetical protein
VEKMVEKGEYDKAFNFSISKLQGEKNKKTEYVKALEKAFFKLNGASMRTIEKLDAASKPENWSQVLNIYLLMEKRQERLEPLLPLMSEDRYVGTFDLKNYSEAIRNAEDNTCLFYYNNALALLQKTEKTGDKAFARQAYDNLRKIDNFKSNYKETDELKQKALNLGLISIHFDIYNDLRDFQSYSIERELVQLPVAQLNDIWHEYTIGQKLNSKPDYIINIELNHIDFSPERERVNSYTESKEVLIRKDKVKEKRDTTEVWVEKEVYEKVKADVIEIFREKKSELHGRISIVDNRTRENLKSIPVNVFHNFNGYGCRYLGDERALTNESKRKLDGHCELFPSDGDMAADLAVAFKNVVMDESRKIKYK